VSSTRESGPRAGVDPGMFTITLIPESSAAADEIQRFHHHDRVEVLGGAGDITTIYGVGEPGDVHCDITPAGLRNLLRRAYLAGFGDGSEPGRPGRFPAAMRELDTRAEQRLAHLEESPIAELPDPPEAGQEDGSSTVMSLDIEIEVEEGDGFALGI
jgi:hypothetical protein